MKIKIDNQDPVFFSNVKCGDVFTTGEGAYIKCDANTSVKLSNGEIVDGWKSDLMVMPQPDATLHLGIVK